jgi:hypothetical protein
MSGEKLHQARMASAKERAEKTEKHAAEDKRGAPSEPVISTEQSREQTKRQMITAVKSLAFDVIRAIDQSCPSEALEHSITLAQQRIKAFRDLNAPDSVPDILRNALSVDVAERSAPESFVFSEERERNAKDGTDKTALAYKQVTHAVLKKLKKIVLERPPIGYDESYYEIERCFRLWREAEIDRYQYQTAHPRQSYAYPVDWLSETSLATLRSIAKRSNGRLHKQAVKTLSNRGFIKPLRKTWRLTPDGERAIKYHTEKEAFYAKLKDISGMN